MSEECKYCKTSQTCLEMADYGSFYCLLHREIPRVIEKTYEELQQENQQLRNNWNDLKQFIDNAIYNSQYLYNLNTVNQYEDGINAEVYLNVAKKMEELERNNIDAYKR